MTDLSATVPSLVVTGGPHDGVVVTMDAAERMLGSSPDCHVRLQLGNVEAIHATLTWDEHGLVLSDAGTKTGTYVNGEKIGPDQPLADGDRVCLGPPGSKESVKLLVRLPQQAALPAAIEFEEPEPIVLEEGPAGTPLTFETPIEEPAAPPPAAPPPAATPAPVPLAAAAPSPPPPPRPEPRKPQRPEYTDEMPSISGGDRVREKIDLPPMEPVHVPAKRAKRPSVSLSIPEIPRPLIFGLAGVAVLVGAYYAARPFLRPPPTLASVTPPRAEPGQTVTLTGTGFDSDAARNAVRFDDEVAQVSSASEAQLTVTVPAGLGASGTSDHTVTVEVRGKKAASGARFSAYRAPKITGLTPDVALPGEAVVAAGQNLAGKGMTLTVGGLPATISESAADSLRFVVPDIPSVVQGRSVAVAVRLGDIAGPPVNLVLGRLPLVTEVAPNQGPPGTRVTLKGRGFDASPAGNLVTVGGQRVLLTQASETELVLLAPGGSLDTQPQAAVVVEAKGSRSTGAASFTIVRPSASVFVPRFFPAPVLEHAAHDHVFVASELGPLLLLTGKADAASTPERALKVAAALNALFEQASAKPLAVELREKPTPAVAAVGAADALVAATREDAAGYDEPWDPANKGRRSSPKAVAQYWTALLQDHLALFALRQRPQKTVELSVRGKVLMEMYSDAARRAGSGAGVPTSTVANLSGATSRALRDLALLLPIEGQGVGGAAVAGLWEGTSEEAGQGSRRVEVRLKLEGTRLTGSLNTKSGGLSMDVPIREASYEKGVLSFVVVIGGSPRRYSGSVQGETMTGTISGGPQMKDSLGTFSLRYTG